LFAALWALSLSLWWHSLIATLTLALAGDAYTHILLVFPISIALVYLERNTVRFTVEWGFKSGVALMLLGLLATAIAKWSAAISVDARLSWNMFALVIFWIGCIVLCFGLRTFRSLVFPLCFLFLIVPIPEFALSRTVEWLQQQSALAARIMFRCAGVPVTQDGIMLSIPNLDIEVARECSSIRSSLMLVITTTVMSHLLLRSWWRKAVLVAVSVPLSVVKNGLRIFVIGELGTRVNPEFLDGNLHHHGGILFLALALGGVSVLLWLLRRTETPDWRLSEEPLR